MTRIEWQGRPIDLRGRRRGERLEVEVDGERHAVAARWLEPGLAEIDLGSRRVLVHVRREGDSLWVSAGGRAEFARVLGATIAAAVHPPGAAGSPSAAVGPAAARVARPGTVTAPTAGVVVRCLATVGDRVTAGQPVLALESMKTEIAVRSDVAGTVRRLAVAEGAEVAAGDVLVEIEAA